MAVIRPSTTEATYIVEVDKTLKLNLSCQGSLSPFSRVLFLALVPLALNYGTVHQFPTTLLFPTLPMNTTKTAQYAAAAARISCRLALVKNESPAEKSSVNTNRTPMHAALLCGVPGESVIR